METTYNEVDMEALMEKMTNAFLFVVKEIKEGDTPDMLFNYIQKTFSYSELVMLASVHVAQDVATKLEKDPMFRHLVKMARAEDERNKKMNK